MVHPIEGVILRVGLLYLTLRFESYESADPNEGFLILHPVCLSTKLSFFFLNGNFTFMVKAVVLDTSIFRPVIA